MELWMMGGGFELDGMGGEQWDPGAPELPIERSNPFHWPDLFWWLR